MSSIIERFSKAAQSCPEDFNIYGKLIWIVFNSLYFLTAASIWCLLCKLTE